MSTRDEVAAIITEAAAALNAHPVQQMNALAGDAENYNVNVANTRFRAIEQALLLLADKVDAASR